MQDYFDRMAYERLMADEDGTVPPESHDEDDTVDDDDDDEDDDVDDDDDEDDGDNKY